MTEATGEGLVSVGGDTLGRSGPVRVYHAPNVVAFGLTESEDGRIDSETSFTRDSGGNDPDPTINLLLYAEDHHSNVSIQVYISTNASLTDSTVTSDENTFQIAGTTAWMTDDVNDNVRYAEIDVSDSLGTGTYHPAGSYYFYVAISDTSTAMTDSNSVFVRAANLSGLTQSMSVNHSPFLEFNKPRQGEPVVDHRVDVSPILMLAWNGSGVAGDRDIDDNAKISLWFAPADSTPDAFADTLSTWLKKIVSGLREDPDGGANDQYPWDLTQFDGRLPAAGVPIKVWALLDDEGGTPVFVSTSEITFAEYMPLLRLLNPPPGAAREIRENETYRFFFDADLVKDTSINGTVRYLISSLNTDDMTDFTLDTGASARFPDAYNAFWISGADSLQEGVDRYFDWRPADDGNPYITEMTSPSEDNTFYIYALIDREGDPIVNTLLTGKISNTTQLTLAQAPGQIKVNGIGMTVVEPDVVASPSRAQVVAGDTIRVVLKGNGNGMAAQGMRLFVDVDSTQFQIADQDPLAAGVQPFGFETSYFFGSVVVQVNRVNLGTDGQTYELDLEKRNLPNPEDPTGKSIAHIDLIVGFSSGSAGISWANASDNEDRRSSFFNSSGEFGLFDASRDLVTFTSVGRGSIAGFVPLQGALRTSDSKVTTFWLRRPGSWVSISDSGAVGSDSLLRVTNDVDDVVAVVKGASITMRADSLQGIQLQTGADGSFTLSKVPNGIYELVAKSESYLAGYTDVTVVDGQAVTGVQPTRLSDSNDPAQLIGGDINGDNKIDAEDESALNIAYETSTADGNLYSDADIDDDGRVFFSDLLILAANFQVPILSGVDPVYKPTRAINEGTSLEIAGLPLEVKAGEEFELELKLAGAGDITAYTLDLVFDPAVLAVAGVETPLMQGHTTMQIQRSAGSGRYVLAEAFKGAGNVAVEEGPVAWVDFRVLQDAMEPVVSVEQAYIADNTARMVELATRVTRVLPKRFALWQNVPNPFNPSTQISFDVPQDGARVMLTVYNIMGQPVRQLMRSSSVPAGRYTLAWDGLDDEGRKVSSGVYMYTLQAGDFVQSRKMLMMK